MNMRDIRSQVQAPSESPAQLDVKDNLSLKGVGGAQEVSSFGDMFSNAINSVNELQKTSGQLATAYATGDESVSLTDVMVAAEKSSVGFQATVQVRNKLIEAYQDIMNMPV
jgi:flagellar hook-basal body complex protein FliE